MAQLRKRVAIFTAGVIGMGEHDLPIPAVTDCFRELANDNDLTIYSLHDPKPHGVPAGMRARTLPLRTRIHTLNVIILSLRLIADHLTERYDLIHAIAGYPYGSSAVRLGRILQIPSVVTLHTGELASLPEFRFGDLRIRSRHEKLARACRRSTALVTLSRFQASSLPDVGAAPARAEVIPFGIDAERFPYRQNVLQAPFAFLHVCYSQPVKDARTLLETFRNINQVVASRLTIVGKAHIGGETERLVEKFQLQNCVRLAGSVPNRELSAYYERSHFLLHTSRYESQGVVLNEAMASGVVVCSTRVGLAFDLGDDHCITSDVGDSAGLANAVIRVINDEERYQQLRSLAHRWSTSHDATWTAAQYQSIYDLL